MNRTVKSLVAGALMLPALSYAEGLNYNYVEASYSQIDIDDFDVDGDGLGIEGSLALAPTWHVFAGFETAELDGPGNSEVDVDGWKLGVGYNHSINTSTDLVATVAYLKQEIGSFDEDGFGIGLGLRGKVAEGFELEGGIQYADLGDLGDDTSFVAEGRYSFTTAFSAGLGVEVGDDITIYGANFRFNFK